ncbi:MAG: carbamoyltransferase HypF, partial [Gammaproteobacteria bacterium]|nr:carbamoyltransferase HypF [Gammaproteobacteria bacterium]
KNRRYRYAFTNCTHCGPRLTIIDGIPYDRAKTSMASFKLCDHCQREYEDPADRRFHAQPNACPVCGPKVWLQPDPEISEAADTIDAAAKLLQQGKILAIKGLGGFHLACDATNHNVVSLLRNRKHRYKKPFALMARDLDIIRNYCNINPEETSLLQSVEAPIVLLERNSSTEISDEVAPELNNLGFMLPYTPLHHLLMQDLSFPIVMTSGNVSDIPQCTDNDQAQHQLSDIADFFLLNDRDIRNRVDDSVARVVTDKVRLLRRARGYAPATITLPPGFNKKIEVLAFGAELKNTFCMVKNGQAILSQHMGDLENAETLFDYKKNLHLYQLMFDHKPSLLVVDKHPEYLSTKVGYEMAQTNAVTLKEVQHHHAHVTACLAENNWPLDGGKVLGVVLDGLGLGNDGTIWGCEFLHADYYEADRLGSLSTISLLGGTQAMLEPWRNTFSHLVSIMNWEELERNYQHLELVSFLKQKPVHNLLQMLDKGINSPLASSAGRLFDAVAGALGICRDKQFYEGQAAIELEALVTRALITEYENNPYSFTIDINTENKIPRLNPEKM